MAWSFLGAVTASLLPAEPSRRREESQLQKTIVDYARWALPRNAFMFAVPNGGLRRIEIARRLVGEGVRAGVPDLVLFHDGHALCIEVKVKNTYPSQVQRQVHEKIMGCGILVVIVRSLDEWIRAVQSFGIHLRVSANDDC